MSFVPSLLGIGGGSGLNYQAQRAGVEQGVTANQALSYAPQAQQAVDQQALLANQYFGLNPIGKQQQVFEQQQALANQLQGVANGQGPNPALAQLNQATAQNVNQQAALMASQRGAGANAGLLARQAAQQGGTIQQQAAGQAATMQAQQQLAGMQALQSQQGQLASLANTQAGQLGQAVGGYNQAVQSEQQNLFGALGNYNNANIAMQSNLNNVNAGIQGGVGQGQSALLGGALNGAAAYSGLAGKSGGGGAVAAAHGGLIKNYADGGLAAPLMNGPQSFQGRYLFGSAPAQGAAVQNQMIEDTSGANKGANSLYSGMNNAGMAMGRGISSWMKPKDSYGDAPYMDLAENEIPEVSFEAKGGPIIGEQLAAKGKQVPGSAKVKGDNLKNDTVPAMLSPKEIVIPRSITMAPDAPKRAAEFVAKVLAKNGMRK